MEVDTSKGRIHDAGSVSWESMKRAASTPEAIQQEDRYGAHNYHPLPVVLTRGQGVHLWDPEGKRYIDFLSAYSAVNQGHCHPRIISALTEQAQRLTLTSRAFHNDSLGPFCEFVSRTFGYERVLPANGGVEAWEASIKLARKWGYQKKKIPEGRAKIVVCVDNFHGRTMAAVSASTSAESRNEYGPYLPGFVVIPFNDIPALEQALRDPEVVAFNAEPIQGEAGIIVPAPGYLKQVSELCRKAGVLFIADEIQTGIARTGKLLACDHEGVKPDILTLGKALSGGVMPVSAILTSSEIMLCIRPGEHGSTFGGNPLACQVAIAALEVVRDEKLAENSEKMGQIFRQELGSFQHPLVAEVRGKGLMNALVIHPNGNASAWDVCTGLMKNGVLAKPTRDNIIRFTPPLIITEEQIQEGVAAIRKTLGELA